jgi:hypothetical protein
MRLAILSVLCLLTACFTEPSADRVWRCSVEQPLCPEGQTCVNDWCAKDGIATPDLASGSDGMLDMSMLKPCADGFPLGTQGVWACRGKFSPTTTVAPQHFVKMATSSVQMVSRLTDAECSNSSIKGFFFADVPAEGSTGSKCCREVCTRPCWELGLCGLDAAGIRVLARQVNERSSLCKNLPLITYCDNAQ